MLLDNAESWDVDTLQKYYHGLLKSANGQVNLLYNLLNWAQIQTGRMPFQPTLFDLVAELQRTDIPLLRDMANRKNIELIVQMPESALVMGDANMLAIVVRNLIINALKFTNPGGTVTLTISSSTTKAAHNTPIYRISVSDTGIGMTTEQILNLFTLNCQTSKRGTAGEQGAGIGLIVCKELLEKHGTTLRVESKINEGSCFSFENFQLTFFS
jgi:signal transduction histidine kinase